MFTRSEKTYLILTLAFLAAGSGIKAWRKSAIRLGPFPDTATLALDSSRTASMDTIAVHSDSASPQYAIAVGTGAQAPDAGDSSTLSSARGQAKRTGASLQSQKVDLNRADAAGLARVKGIGAKTAQAILEYRRAHGAFRDLKDLMQVKGIGEKKLEKLAPYLTVRPDSD